MKRIYLPIVRRPRAKEEVLRNPVGAEIEGVTLRPDLLRGDRHYKLGVRWVDFEKEPGVFQLDPETIETLGYLGSAERYISFKTCPEWYREWPEYQGSRPKREFWPQMGKAMTAAMLLTGARRGELLNEPNMRVTEVKPATQWYFGAGVGPEEGFYEAGYVYGEMLLAVRKVVQEQVPGGDVMAGGLFVDAGWNLEDERTGDYVKGMLAAHRTWKSSKLQACAVSMHAYLYHYDVLKDTAAFEKPVRYAQELGKMTGAPVIFSETAIIKNESYPDTPEFRKRQGEWAGYLKQAIREGKIAGWSWYNWASVWPWKRCSLSRGEERGDVKVEPTEAYEVWRGE